MNEEQKHEEYSKKSGMGKGKRILLSIISVAVMVALVFILIVSAVRAQEVQGQDPAVIPPEEVVQTPDQVPIQQEIIYEEIPESQDIIYEEVPVQQDQFIEQPAPAPEQPVSVPHVETEIVTEMQPTQQPETKQEVTVSPDVVPIHTEATTISEPESSEPSTEIPSETTQETTQETEQKPEENKSYSSLLHRRSKPVVSKDFHGIDGLNSEYAVLMDADTGTVIAGRQALKRIYPASMTKVMTLLTAVDYLDDLKKEFSISREESDELYRAQASVAGFLPDEKVNAVDLMYGLILPSGADGALGLAKVTAGGMEQFAEYMNIEALRLGLKDSHFTNTSGLHDPNHYTTVMDMAVIFAYAMDNELCSQILSSPSYTTAKTEQHPDGIQLWSHAFAYMSGTEMNGWEMEAGKTGYTEEARSCMVTSAKKDGHRYIAVTAYCEGKSAMCQDHINMYKSIV